MPPIPLTKRLLRASKNLATSLWIRRSPWVLILRRCRHYGADRALHLITSLAASRPFWGIRARRLFSSCVRKLLKSLERAKGFEPSTPTLARLCSTPELRPRPPGAITGSDAYHMQGVRVAQGSCTAIPGAASCRDARTPDARRAVRRVSTRSASRTRPIRHPPVFTVEEAKSLRGTLPGGHCKCLFLKDKKAGLWLVVALEECRVDLKALADALGAPRFSFGSASCCTRCSASRPGSVTPFAAINDPRAPRHGGAAAGDAGARSAQLPPARKHRDDGGRAGRSRPLSRSLRARAAHRRHPERDG